MNKILSIKEFRELGLLQEVNRKFFHPLGLALAVELNYDGTESLKEIIDSRDDPEGFIFGDLTTERHVKYSENVQKMFKDKEQYRKNKFGFHVQPIGTKIEKE